MQKRKVRRWLLVVMVVCVFNVIWGMTAFAAGSVVITTNTGGVVTNFRGQASTSGSGESITVYVNDDNPITFDIVPNEGYQIYGVYMNDQELSGYSGKEAQTLQISPKGATVRIRVNFRSDAAMEAPTGQITLPQKTATPTATPTPTPTPAPSKAPQQTTSETTSKPVPTSMPAQVVPEEEEESPDSTPSPSPTPVSEEGVSPAPSPSAQPSESPNPEDSSDPSLENDVSSEGLSTMENHSTGALNGAEITDGGVGTVSAKEEHPIDLTTIFLGVSICVAAIGAGICVVHVMRKRKE